MSFRGPSQPTEARRIAADSAKATARANGPRKSPADDRSPQSRKHAPCGGYTPELSRFISGYRSGDREFKSGQDLFSLGAPCDAIYNLVAGWVALYKVLEDGRRQILHFALPGAVLAFHPAGGAMAAFSAQALTDVVTCVISHRALTSLAEKEPGLGMRLACLIAHDRNFAFDRLTSIGRHSARERIAYLLLELFIRFRSQWPGNRIEEMYLPLTQEHIADATGLTFVHVNRILRNLRQDGIVEFHYRRLRILDPDKLIDIAGVDPQLAMSWIGRRLPE